MCTPLLLTVGAVCCAHLEWLRSVIKQLVTTAQFEICATFRYCDCQQLCTMWKLSRFMHLHKKYMKPDIHLRSFSTNFSFQEGREIEGFTVTQTGNISEHMRATCLTHLETGAQYVHLDKNDKNNVFGVGFRTITEDSTGLPHILEHTTLCGSKNYPCRDPFFKMLNRSMATYMNAMTGPDFTLYAFSTQNLQDFKNLMAVYLDAVFNPLLKESDFLQEGWRLEHQIVSDENSPIVIKGVVYNEMKGVFSDNQSLFCQLLLNKILPSHTYGHVWGGDPSDIVKLNQSDLRLYHKKHYNPSNAIFYSYGNFPLEYNLRYLSEYYLSGTEFFKRYDIPSEKRWSSPVYEHVGCRFDPLVPDKEKQSTIAFSSICCDVTDVQDTFEMGILSTLLLKGPNSAFYKSFIEAGQGFVFSPVTGYEDQIKDTIFSVGLQCVRPSDFDRINGIYHNTIDNVIAEGFNNNDVEAVLNEVELSNKLEGSNYGLRLLMKIVPMWNHGGNVIENLQQNECLLHLRSKLEDDPKYFQDKVFCDIKNQTHKLVLSMSPEKDYEAKRMNEEEKILNDKLCALSPSDANEIYQKGLERKEFKYTAQDCSSLPTLTVADLTNSVERVPCMELPSSNIPLYVFTQPVNETTHLRAVFNTKEINSEAKNLVPLFCAVAAQMGTKNHSFREFEQMVRLKTGGILFNQHIAEDVNKVHTYEEGIVLYSHCLDKNVSDMYSLLSELLICLDLEDVQRFELLLRQLAIDAVNSIFDSGHLYAITCSASLVSPSAHHIESWSGLSYVKRLQDIVHQEKFPEVLSSLRSLSNELIGKMMSRAAVSLCEKNVTNGLKESTHFLNMFCGTGTAIQKTKRDGFVQFHDEGIHHIHNIPVNFVAKSIMTTCPCDTDFAALTVLARLLSNMYLHPLVREDGGAYGSGACLSYGGVFSFFSYRDPNSFATLDIFDKACDWVKANKFSDTDIEEAKLGVFQKLDVPILPEEKGMRKFLYDIEADVFQTHRERVMSVTREQIFHVSEKFLKSSRCGKAIIGPQNSELKERVHGKWTDIH